MQSHKSFFLITEKKSVYLTHDNKSKEISFPYRKFMFSELCKKCIEKFIFDEKQGVLKKLETPRLLKVDICQQCQLSIQ